MSDNAVLDTETHRLREPVGGRGLAPAPEGARVARILVADDEEGIRRAACRALERYGYSVLQARNGVEALARLVEHAGAIDLVLADVSMPLLNGLELRTAASRRGVECRFLFTSGYGEDDFHGAPGWNADEFLEKPWTTDALAGRVRELLAADGAASVRGEPSRS